MPLLRERVRTAAQEALRAPVVAEPPVVQEASEQLDQLLLVAEEGGSRPTACHSCLFHVDEVVCGNPAYPRRCPAAAADAAE
jgi:hypothetical protein